MSELRAFPNGGGRELDAETVLQDARDDLADAEYEVESVQGELDAIYSELRYAERVRDEAQKALDALTEAPASTPEPQ